MDAEMTNHREDLNTISAVAADELNGYTLHQGPRSGLLLE